MTADEFIALCAVAAQSGIRIEVIEHDDGPVAYAVSRWTLTREFASLELVREFLRSMGVAVEGTVI